MPGPEELFHSLKANATTNGPYLCIPVGSPVAAVLRPVATTPGRLNANDVRVLTEWRNRYVGSFLTEFTATEAGTEKWLTGVVGPDPGRILFMLDTARGETVGYLGLAFINWQKQIGEADAVARGRGRRTAPHGAGDGYVAGLGTRTAWFEKDRWARALR